MLRVFENMRFDRDVVAQQEVGQNDIMRHVIVCTLYCI